MYSISGVLQISVVNIALLLICHSAVIQSLIISYEPFNATVDMDATQTVNYTIFGDPIGFERETYLQIYSQDELVVTGLVDVPFEFISLPITGSFNLTGVFLGQTLISCKGLKTNRKVDGDMDIIVIRKKRLVDNLFIISVASLFSLLYINFGCILNWEELKRNVRRPIGPAIGITAHFFAMPLISFALGKLLFPDNPYLQLGMFFTGASPAGGASNVWTLLLGGNVDLSITMTTVSTLGAFAMMPLWIFTLGKVIFDHAKLGVPYDLIAGSAIGLIVPLCIGILIAKYYPKIADFLRKILKGLSAGLIIFIVIFAIITNLYLFKLISWRIVIAGMGLPYIGYLLAYSVAKLIGQSRADCIAIGIESGMQNTGIAIFLLKFALTQPHADLSIIAPVAVAIMTPIPLFIIFIIKQLRSRFFPTSTEIENKGRLRNEAAIVDNLNKVSNERNAAPYGTMSHS